jgi:uncharacterized phage protein (TIGR01671 family)
MGREIKFRGRRKDNGKWTYGDLIQLLGEQGCGRKFIVDNRFGACIDENGDFLNTEAPFVNEVDPETVGQYSGLQDDSEDGFELYEGDVAELHSDDGKQVCKIEFWAGTFMLVADSLPDGYEPLHERVEYDRKYGWVRGVVRLGDIYRNPELIEV